MHDDLTVGEAISRAASVADPAKVVSKQERERWLARLDRKRESMTIWLRPDTIAWVRSVRERYGDSIQGAIERILEQLQERHKPPRLCACGCGRELFGTLKQVTATPACRKRLQRKKSHSTVTPGH